MASSSSAPRRCARARLPPFTLAREQRTKSLLFLAHASLPPSLPPPRRNAAGIAPRRGDRGAVERASAASRPCSPPRRACVRVGRHPATRATRRCVSRDPVSLTERPLRSPRAHRPPTCEPTTTTMTVTTTAPPSLPTGRRVHNQGHEHDQALRQAAADQQGVARQEGATREHGAAVWWWELLLMMAVVVFLCVCVCECVCL